MKCLNKWIEWLHKWLRRIVLWGYLYPLLAIFLLWYFDDKITRTTAIIATLGVVALVVLWKKRDLVEKWLGIAKEWCWKQICFIFSKIWEALKQSGKGFRNLSMKNMQDKLAPRILIALLLGYSYYEAWRDSNWIPSIILTILVTLLCLMIKPIKIWLCKMEYCGVIVKPKHFRLVMKGGHALEWAVAKGLEITGISGELKETASLPTHPGSELGIWWTGWFSSFLGISFPMLPIEKVSKRKDVSPDAKLSDQYSRSTKDVKEIRYYINRFVISVDVELNDGSKVTIALYGTNGHVKYPEKFVIDQADDQFAIWESAASSSLSSCLRGYSFDELFRKDKEDKAGKKVKAYEIIREHMENDEAIKRAQETIGMDGVHWHMEAWSDTSDAEILTERNQLSKNVAKQVAETRRAEAGVATAAAQADEKKAQQRVSEEELIRRLKLLGVNSPAELTLLGEDGITLLRQIQLATDAGDLGAEVIKGYQGILKRKAAPGLSVLVEEGAVQLGPKGGAS
ncbi:MAG: hypothetical protein V4438_04505 [Patescibacteria group bacterium]